MCARVICYLNFAVCIPTIPEVIMNRLKKMRIGMYRAGRSAETVVAPVTGVCARTTSMLSAAVPPIIAASPRNIS